MNKVTAPQASAESPEEERGDAVDYLYDDDDTCWQCGGDGGWNSCMEDTCGAAGGEDGCDDERCWKRCDICRGKGYI